MQTPYIQTTCVGHDEQQQNIGATGTWKRRALFCNIKVSIFIQMKLEINDRYNHSYSNDWKSIDQYRHITFFLHVPFRT